MGKGHGSSSAFLMDTPLASTSHPYKPHSSWPEVGSQCRHGQSPIHSFMKSLWWWMRDEWGPHSDPPAMISVHPHPQTCLNIVLKLTPTLFLSSPVCPFPVPSIASTAFSLVPIPTQPPSSLHSYPQASSPPSIHSHPQFHPHIHLNLSLVQPQAPNPEIPLWWVDDLLSFSCSALSGSFVTPWPVTHLQDCRVLCLWDFPGKSTGVGCHFFLQGFFSTQRWNLSLLQCRWILYPWATWEVQVDD